MKNYLCTLLFFFGFAFGKSKVEKKEYLTRYHQLVKNNKFGQLGNYKNGEIEILVEPQQIEQAQNLQKKKFLLQGMPENAAVDSSRVGVVSEDGYWIFTRDAVLFPTGMMGLYNRIIKKSSLENPSSGAAILPVLKNKKMVFIVSFRHATRSWELEVVRGYSEKGESALATAKRELLEETGLIADKYKLLGRINPDSGIVSSCVPIYYAHVETEQNAIGYPDDSEAINCFKALTKSEIKSLLVKGDFTMKVGGKDRKVFVRDSYIPFALLQAEEQGLL